MEVKAERRFPRVQLGQVPARILSKEPTAFDGYVEYISKESARIWKCRPQGMPNPAGGTYAQVPWKPGDDVSLSITGFTGEVNRTCKVHKVGPGFCLLKFVLPLTDNEMSRIIDGYSSSYLKQPGPEVAAALSDQAEVRAQIRDIQNCRSNIFVATIGAMAAAAFTIQNFAMKGPVVVAGADAASTSPDNFRPVVFGIAVTFLLFVIGAFVTIEKARAINIRKGFLKELSRRLRVNDIPIPYYGWSWYHIAFLTCGRMHAVCECSYKKKTGANVTCRDTALGDAATLNDVAKLVPSMLSSFMSLSSVVYAVVYFLIGAAAWHYIPPRLIAVFRLHSITAWTFFIGAILASPFLYKCWDSSRDELSGFKNSLIVPKPFKEHWQTIEWYKVSFAGAVLTTILIACFFAFGSIAGYAAISGIGLFIGYVGWYLILQTNRVRKGVYSLDTCCYTWKVLLTHCTPVFSDPRKLSSCKTSCWFKRLSNAFIDWLLVDDTVRAFLKKQHEEEERRRQEIEAAERSTSAAPATPPAPPPPPS